jgi:hypothetical protein
MVTLYFICEFLVIYFSVKIWGKEIKRKEVEKRMEWVDTQEFWKIVLLILFWAVLLPSMAIWKLLDKLTEKFFNKNQ